MKHSYPLIALIAVAVLLTIGCSPNKETSAMPTEPNNSTLKFATFNISMDASNRAYQFDNVAPKDAISHALVNGNHQHARNIAEIIQRTQPDIILLNEFDYISDPQKGVEAFIENYLNKPQNGSSSIDYPYYYVNAVNTGVNTEIKEKNVRLRQYGFGKYPGQYGMVLLSKYPIQFDDIRTFQHFLWKDMPNNLMPVDEAGLPWYSAQETEVMRLSSKSHWDIPILVNGNIIHVLASHPTPPVFDGPEDRNGRRNHDEIRFWKDYIETSNVYYHYDDKGKIGGLETDAAFVILGDLNANDLEGDAYPGAIEQLLTHSKVLNYPTPSSLGGKQHKADNTNALFHTAEWGMRADYVLPSVHFDVIKSGVFWPTKDSEEHRLVEDRQSSSDHRLVWLDVVLKK